MPKVKQQPSRKGKAAWRKNIDISSIEAALENERAAERAGLAPVNEQTASSSIFVEDRAGDEEVAKVQKKKLVAGKKPLKSLSILRQKDQGLAPVLGRARKADKARTGEDRTGGLTPEQRAKLNGMTRKDMDKLRRLAGRDVRGAFGVIEEEARDGNSTKRGPQAVLSETYDVWTAPDPAATSEDVEELSRKTRKVKAPSTILQVRSKDVSLPLPDQGQSYNPSAEAHEALLTTALKHAQTEAEANAIEVEFMKIWKSGQGRGDLLSGETIEDKLQHMLGMKVNVVGEDADSEESSEDEDSISSGLNASKKMAKRKTKQQRTKAKRVKEELRARLALKAEKQSREQLKQLRSLKKKLASYDDERLERALERREARERRLEDKVGMFKIPKRDKEVQLGEDLAENLRGLKPEGNLLRDRLEAFQKRGLVIPKHSATGRNRRSTRVTARSKEYETHSYKRFS